MKIHLRADKADGWHTTFTVFVNGVQTGQLKMSGSEALAFHEIISFGIDAASDDFVSSGEWAPPDTGGTVEGRRYVRRGLLREKT